MLFLSAAVLILQRFSSELFWFGTQKRNSPPPKKKRFEEDDWLMMNWVQNTRGCCLYIKGAREWASSAPAQLPNSIYITLIITEWSRSCRSVGTQINNIPHDDKQNYKLGQWTISNFRIWNLELLRFLSKTLSFWCGFQFLLWVCFTVSLFNLLSVWIYYGNRKKCGF